MILYFSGTGNSRYVAKKISSQTGDEVVDVSYYLRKKENALFNSKYPYVFVCPAYASYIPRVLEKFIHSSVFTGNNKCYFVLTCGAGVTIYGMGRRLSRLCSQKGFAYCGMEKIVMPENYICLYFAPKEETSKKIIEKAEPIIKETSVKIERGENLKRGALLSLATDIVNPIFYKTLVSDRFFKVKDNCTGCGLCEKVCPLANIVMENGKPVWKGNCTQCQGCIARCPVEAIEFGIMTKHKRRYYLPDKDEK